MSQWWACMRYFSGTTSISFISTSSGVLPTARPVRLPTRKMWVSTAMVGSPKATLSTTFAVLRDFAAGFGDELPRQRDDVFRLGTIEPDGLDQVTHARLAERGHLFRR